VQKGRAQLLCSWPCPPDLGPHNDELRAGKEAVALAHDARAQPLLVVYERGRPHCRMQGCLRRYLSTGMIAGSIERPAAGDALDEPAQPAAQLLVELLRILHAAALCRSSAVLLRLVADHLEQIGSTPARRRSRASRSPARRPVSQESLRTASYRQHDPLLREGSAVLEDHVADVAHAEPIHVHGAAGHSPRRSSPRPSRNSTTSYPARV
jgi:hypothetical protein